ncbi:MerR family transcriptional regulator [Actinoallomurus bryophytorum]|uniref:DNA-binding transcriptional MerR regulator n=1 Tax=Actinoallomurus bryophytorum TaxID=1490222 RepID=A0A543CLP2_9ACTN|nr:MerR family transcriptional regulator [Actinoallomurus bryophytorum]TQL97827.1 DNA-binding transcriptional MerR regulator [Actinoallomurus bryophytorum]
MNHEQARTADASMLTIGRLAAYVGVTVRAVRHYHQRGLMTEPDRDVSGYRRYDAQAVVDLIRIKTLSDAGVPLARVGELLDAEPSRFSEAITEIDKALTERIRDLERQRGRIAELAAGERLLLPGEVVDYLDALRDIGVSPRTVRMERDAWILVAARFPADTPEWAKDKLSTASDPEFQRIYLEWDEAFDWDRSDPRLEDLADATVAYARRSEQDRGESEWEIDEPLTVALVAAQPGISSPAWDRLDQLCRDRMSGS